MYFTSGIKCVIVFVTQDKILLRQWKDELVEGFKKSAQIMASINKKASKIFGANVEE